MKLYNIYQSHLGGLYAVDEALEEPYEDDDFDVLYCDTCGDSEWFLGTLYQDSYPTEEDMKALLEE